MRLAAALFGILAGLSLSAQEAPSPSAPPASLGLDPFYAKYLDAAGIPVVGSGKVSDDALRRAREIVLRMVSKRDDARKELIRAKVRVAIMAPSEKTTDIPEHRDLPQAFPKTDWNKRCRGVGATAARPACSAGEENLLGLPGDPYRGETILVHEFGHTLLTMGIQAVDRTFGDRVRASYRAAMDKGLWQKTYAASNAGEYWAEGVQSWFDANRWVAAADGVHNEVGTRGDLRKYDPGLAALVSEVFPDDDWRCAYSGKSRK